MKEKDKDKLSSRWVKASKFIDRGPDPWYGCAKPLEVDEDQLKREAEAGRELMKKMS